MMTKPHEAVVANLDHRILYEFDHHYHHHHREECDRAYRFMIGLILLITTPITIFWNEHQSVKLCTTQPIANKVVHDLDNPKALSKQSILDGKFTCFSGRLVGGETLSDTLFPCVIVPQALMLWREMEIYQYHVVTKNKRQRKVLL